jgi:hypothetical protein
VPYYLPGIGEDSPKLVDGGFATLEALTTATAEALSSAASVKTAERFWRPCAASRVGKGEA